MKKIYIAAAILIAVALTESCRKLQIEAASAKQEKVRN
jgi:hypothetical protein